MKILFLAPELVARGSTVPLASAPEAGNAVPLLRPGRGRA